MYYVLGVRTCPVLQYLAISPTRRADRLSVSTLLPVQLASSLAYASCHGGTGERLFFAGTVVVLMDLAGGGADRRFTGLLCGQTSG